MEPAFHSPFPLPLPNSLPKHTHRRPRPTAILHLPTLPSTATRRPSDGAIMVRNAFPSLPFPCGHILRLVNLDVRDVPIRLLATGGASIDAGHRRRLPPLAAGALERLAAAHGALGGAGALRGRVAVVEDTPCPRMHVDKVRLRTVATIVGPGVVVARGREGAGGRVESGEWESDGEGGDVVEARRGDVVFLYGSGKDDGERETAAVHRSPRVVGRARRLVLQIDEDV